MIELHTPNQTGVDPVLLEPTRVVLVRPLLAVVHGQRVQAAVVVEAGGTLQVVESYPQVKRLLEEAEELLL